MSNRPCLSGAQKRKKQKQIKENNEKLPKIDYWFKRTQPAAGHDTGGGNSNEDVNEEDELDSQSEKEKCQQVNPNVSEAESTKNNHIDKLSDQADLIELQSVRNQPKNAHSTDDITTCDITQSKLQHKLNTVNYLSGLPQINKAPHHPSDSFKFPFSDFGNTHRSFQHSWLHRWPWLHYEEQTNKAYCYYCVKAVKEKKLVAANAELSFISIGFCNWKKAIEKFKSHETSATHKDAVIVCVQLSHITQDITETINYVFAEEKKENQRIFLKILSSIKYLARQGLAFRGHVDDNSNFLQLLRLRSEDDENILKYLQRKTGKYTSHEVQNEILNIMGLQVLREIADSLRDTQFLAIMLDETCDSSNKEQAVFCIRWVDDDLEAHEEFIGLYEIDNTEANTLFKIAKDVLTRLNISFQRLRGQCYDGASAMRGVRNGLATQVRKMENRALYTHCYGHSLNLACSDTIKKIDIMSETLETTYEIVKLIKKSPRRQSHFEKIKEELSKDAVGIRVLCPTRWTVKAESMKSILDNYETLQELWEECMDFVKDTEMRARIRGVSYAMKSFRFLFGLMLGHLVLIHSDNLSKTLQSGNMSAAAGQSVASMTVKTLEKIRSETEFDFFWAMVERKRENLEIEEASLPRKRKRPIRYETGDAQSEFHTNAKDLYRQVYYETIDTIVTTIKERFDQEGFRIYVNLEKLLIKACNGESFQKEMEAVMDFYQDDLDKDLLSCQLLTLKVNIPDSVQSYKDIQIYLKGMTAAERGLFSEVIKTIKLLLVMSATNAVSERSFSALRCIKSYLRATMTQGRLNNVMLLHIHKQQTDKLDLITVANEFVDRNERRLSAMGKFRDENVRRT